MKRMEEDTIERLRTDMELQSYSFLKICKCVVPEMKKRAFGRVTVMLSKVVTEPLPPAFMAPYVVSKYALMGAMKAVAAEYDGSKVTVNGIAPDMMDTAFLADLDERIKEIAAEKSAIGRLIRPEEIAPYIFDLMENMEEKNGRILSVAGEMVKKDGERE